MPHYPHAQSDNRTLTRATTRPTATTHSRRKFPPETSVRPATAAPGRGGRGRQSRNAQRPGDRPDPCAGCVRFRTFRVLF